jgi:hypothetical protein
MDKNRIPNFPVHPQFSLARIARRGKRWIRNPSGKGFSWGHPASFRKRRRDRRAAGKPRVKTACYREKPPPWNPKESLSPPGPGLHTKLGVGDSKFPVDKFKILIYCISHIFYLDREQASREFKCRNHSPSLIEGKGFGAHETTHAF